MPRAASSNGPKKGRAPKGHQIAVQFPSGTVLTDTQKKQWKLGQIIGQGGFGIIYLAEESCTGQVTDKSASYVIKIEPITNGPLYCEMQFYIRAAQESSIKKFVSDHKLKYLPVPHFNGKGTYTFKTQDYRFLVIPRFGTDLQKLLISSGGTFPVNTVFAIGLRMVDALQYLHEREYVHADIKASNIMLGYHAGKEISNEIYLCDYGLAYRYIISDQHKPYKEDPRKAHEGTIEFTSRDAHKGVYPSRRGDLEILGFCMLQWLFGKLPWEDRFNDQNYVADRKSHYMDNVKSLIKDCRPGDKVAASDTMLKYMDMIKKLDYDEEPNYASIKTLLKSGLTKSGQKDEWKIELSPKPKTQKRKSTDALSSVVSPKQRRTASPKKILPASRGTPKSKTSPQKATGKKSIKSPPSAKRKAKSSSPVQKVANGVNGRKASSKAKTPQSRTQTTLPPKSQTSPKAKGQQILPPSKLKTTVKPKVQELPPPSKHLAPRIPHKSKPNPGHRPSRSKTIQIPPPSKHS